jgi:hypothetical protein
MTFLPNRSSLAAALALATAVPALLLGACSPSSKTDAKPAASSVASAPASASVPAPASSADPPEERRGGDEILPVYPADAGAPDPLAQRYCDAVYLLPARRTAECCDGASVPAAPFAQQCVRTLTYALGHHAAALAPEDVDRCVEALTKATAGCDWVTPLTAPLPPACLGIVKGALAEKAQCRSSLECASGMRCQGLSTVDFGACAPPKPSGTGCNLAVDMLAVFTRQDGVDRDHPECQGQCARTSCRDAAAIGAACSNDRQCGKNRCVDAKCSSAPLPAAGEACAGGACAYGARCVKGTCTAPKAEGEACEASTECRGECARGDGGAAGKCQKTCPFVGSFSNPVARPKGAVPGRR